MVKSVKTKYVDQYNKMKEERTRLDRERDDLSKRDVALKETMSEIETEVMKFRDSQRALEMEKEAHESTLKTFEKERAHVEKWARTRAKLEEEISRLKEGILNQFVDKDVIASVKAQYEVQLAELKSQFDAQADLNNELAEVNSALGQKARVQENMLKIKTSSEDTLRKELDSLLTAYKKEVEAVKRALEKKDEELASLRSEMTHLRNKYLATVKANGHLLKQIEEVTHDTTIGSANNGNDNDNNNSSGPSLSLALTSSSESESEEDPRDPRQQRTLSRTISQNKDYVKML